MTGFDRAELLDVGFVHADPGINRLWVNDPDGCYWVDFTNAEEIRDGLECWNPSFWNAVIEYAEEQVASHKLSELG